MPPLEFRARFGKVRLESRLKCDTALHCTVISSRVEDGKFVVIPIRIWLSVNGQRRYFAKTRHVDFLPDQEGSGLKWPLCEVLPYSSGSRQRLESSNFKTCSMPTR